MTHNKQTTVEPIIHYQLQEICAISNMGDHFIVELIEHGVIEPQGNSPTDWRFSPDQLLICKRASRLYNDLEINTPGIALSLQLLGEIEQLRKRLELLES